MTLFQPPNGEAYVEMQLPEASSPFSLRVAFSQIHNSDVVYGTNDYPTSEDIATLFGDLGADEVIILLVRDRFDFERKWQAYVVYTFEGWNNLPRRTSSVPLVIKRVPLSAVQDQLLPSS